MWGRERSVIDIKVVLIVIIMLAMQVDQTDLKCNITCANQLWQMLITMNTFRSLLLSCPVDNRRLPLSASSERCPELPTNGHEFLGI